MEIPGVLKDEMRNSRQVIDVKYFFSLFQNIRGKSSRGIQRAAPAADYRFLEKNLKKMSIWSDTTETGRTLLGVDSPSSLCPSRFPHRTHGPIPGPEQRGAA
jgi:hypothetical protein